MKIHKLKISKAVMKEFLLSATAMFLITVTVAHPELVLAAKDATDGGELAKTKFATGTINLLTDAASTITLVVPSMATVAFIWYGLKLSGASEDEVKPIQKRMKISVIGGVIGLVGGAFLTAIFKYYQ